MSKLKWTGIELIEVLKATNEDTEGSEGHSYEVIHHPKQTTGEPIHKFITMAEMKSQYGSYITIKDKYASFMSGVLRVLSEEEYKELKTEWYSSL